MKRIVFFWIEKYQEIDFMNHEGKFLFENFGVNLSSEFHFEYDWNDSKKELSISKKINENLVVYSDKIYDIKVVVGKNGTGKTTLLNLIGNLSSGKEKYDDLTYAVVWEEEGAMWCYGNNCKCSGDASFKESLSPFTTIMYSSDFSKYHENQAHIENFFDLRTNTLLREKGNDSVVQYFLAEEDRLIDFLVDFSKIKNARNESILWSVLNVPARIIFTFLDDAVLREVSNIVDKTKKDGKSGVSGYAWSFLRKKCTSSFFDEMLFLALLNQVKSGEIVESFFESIQNYMEEKYPEIFRDIKGWVEKINVRKMPIVPGGKETYVAMLNLENDYDMVKEFRDMLRKINSNVLFMPMSLGRPMSTGEKEYISFFSRLLPILKRMRKQKKTFDSLLILDEVDRGLHPEWQRIWFTKFLECLDAISAHYDVKLNIQLLMATHSPFMLSDFADDNVLKLDRMQDESGFKANVKCDYSPTKCFGGNIYDIMKDGFFLESSIGGFVENQITKMINDVKKCKEENRPLSIDYSFVNRIGNPILKSLLLQKIKSAERNK